MRDRLAVAVTGVVAVIVAGMWVAASPAAATRPPDLVCGQAITTDVVLRADLTCSGDGLVIAASGVTVQLAGHTIASSDGTGMGIRLGQPDTDPAAITCVRDVEINGGTITGFFAGIGTGYCRSAYFPDQPPDGGRASSVTLSNNTWGIYTTQRYVVEVDHAKITGPNGVGGPFRVGSATGTVKVTASRIRVTTAEGFSVLGAIGTRPTVERSRLEGGRVYSIDSGITISASRLDGVTMDCSDGSLAVSDSRLVGGGARGSFCGTSFSGNHFVGPGSGVAVAAGGSQYPSSVTDNVFTGWDTAVVAHSDSTTITGNTFRGNGTGVSCVAYCSGTVSANRFLGNAGTGVELRNGTWHVGSNLAVGNGGLGIDAQGPELTVIDDGANIARHNLAPQCIGVACATRP